MANIGWDESTPADTESAGLGDDRIRSLKTSLRQGLAAEHTWPSGGGDSGVHLLGSARAYFGTQSAVSSSGTDGRLMQTSDTSRLFHVGSGGTSYVGGAQALSVGSFPGVVPQRHHWVEEFGYSVLPSSGTEIITIPNSGYSGVPYVFLTSVNTTGDTDSAFQLSVRTIDGASFRVRSSSGGVIVGPAAYVWRSIGTRVL